MNSVERKLILDDYRLSADRPVAYIDESYSTPHELRNSFYILSAVVVPQKAWDILREGIENIAGGNWWHTTNVLQQPDGTEKVARLLKFLSEGDEIAVVALREEVQPADSNGELARAACFQALLLALERDVHGLGEVNLAVLEKRRDRKQQNYDSRLQTQLISSGRLSDGFRMRQASPASEHLLWLPDAICSTVRRNVAHGKSDLLEIIRERIVWV